MKSEMPGANLFVHYLHLYHTLMFIYLFIYIHIYGYKYIIKFACLFNFASESLFSSWQVASAIQLVFGQVLAA